MTGGAGRKTLRLSKAQWSWAFYDFANSAFATTVMAGFFPLFFKSYWGENLSATESTFYLGLANSLVGLALLVLVIPLGRRGDRLGKRKKQLLSLTLVSCLFTALFAVMPQSQWLLPLSVFFLASLGFGLANAIYDSLLVGIAKPKQMDWLSGMGYAFGYLGGGLLFLFNVGLVTKPELFGLNNPYDGVKISFISVAVWWLVFSLPLFAWTPEPKHTPSHVTDLGLLKIWQSLKAHPRILWFLAAYIFYIDAVNTIIKMAVDYGSAIGFRQNDLIAALLLVQFVAFPAALFVSWVGEKIGAIRGIYICIFVYLFTCFFAARMATSTDFYTLAVLIGLVQGGIQALSRSHYAKFVPESETSTYFAVYNLFGKFSAVLGPGLMGLVAYLTGSSRASLIVVVAFFFIGLTLLKISQSINADQSRSQ